MKYLTITTETFQDVLDKADKPVLIDFWASWCGPCRMLGPVVEELAEKHSDKVIVGKVNVDEEPELAAKFNVMTIPTLIVFKDGQVTNTSVGVKTEQEILDLL
ncbi:MAG: thioredoxin [Firmicutes bacterium]|uniref:Thioredoxin n=1 Tax=Candidatus Scybalomonas excrementavium TaxID=2840943 RepID=A0A9D9HYZ0_9FIRM|nr:thioredoxin [Candidatus Scybalomonas excrementavium]